MGEQTGGSELTLILRRVGQGDRAALGELMPLVYEELRRQAQVQMSAEPRGHTLQATALVHEVFVRLAGRDALGFESRRHFFNAAAEAMRRVLVDHARRRRAAKRGGGARSAPLGEGDGDYPVAAAGDEDTDWEALDRALEELRVLDERRYRVVMLRYFAGLTDAQVARSLEVSEKTVERDWRAARLFLLGRVRELGGG